MWANDASHHAEEYNNVIHHAKEQLEKSAALVNAMFPGVHLKLMPKIFEFLSNYDSMNRYDNLFSKMPAKKYKFSNFIYLTYLLLSLTPLSNLRSKPEVPRRPCVQHHQDGPCPERVQLTSLEGQRVFLMLDKNGPRPVPKLVQFRLA